VPHATDVLAIAVRMDVHRLLCALGTVGDREQLLTARVDALALRHALRVHGHHRGGGGRAAVAAAL